MFSMVWKLSSANALNLDRSKIVTFGKELKPNEKEIDEVLFLVYDWQDFSVENG